MSPQCRSVHPHVRIPLRAPTPRFGHTRLVPVLTPAAVPYATPAGPCGLIQPPRGETPAAPVLTLLGPPTRLRAGSRPASLTALRPARTPPEQQLIRRPRPRIALLPHNPTWQRPHPPTLRRAARPHGPCPSGPRFMPRWMTRLRRAATPLGSRSPDTSWRMLPDRGGRHSSQQEHRSASRLPGSVPHIPRALRGGWPCRQTESRSTVAYSRCRRTFSQYRVSSRDVA